jgi:hypothetical protein
MSRWLFTVDAIWKWSDPLNQQTQPAPLSQLAVPTQQTQETLNIFWWSPTTNDLGCFKVGDFIGQGRRMEYCGLTEAVVKCTNNSEISRPFGNWTRDKPGEIAAKISTKLDRRQPVSWFLTAAACLTVALADVMLAFMADFITPPVGFGCWSLSVLMYAGLSTVSWGLQFRKHPPGWLRAISHFFNAFAIVCLVGITGTIVSSQA